MKNIISISFLFIPMLLLNACGSKSSENSKTEPINTTANTAPDEVILTSGQYKLAAISLGSVEMRNLSSVLKVNGVIDVPPQNVVSISAPLGGYVKSTGLLPGQAVHKGQVIAIIENTAFIDIQQDYL